MLLIMMLSTIAAAHGYHNVTLADLQLPLYNQKTCEKGATELLTTSSGAPVEYKDAMEVLNSELFDNEYFMDIITHLNRERIPERVVHGKGGGAFGYFEVTNDITHICKAKLFSAVGKKTPVAVRFSPVLEERGSTDTKRQPRGFAVKFYTEVGIFDIVGLNVEMFIIKDPLFFPNFVHAFKRNPRTDLKPEANSRWDFLTSRPESLNTMMLIFGDRGIPYGYRHMPGFGIHTYELVNDDGEKSYAKFHILPELGIRGFNSCQAIRTGGEDPDYANKDLYNAIANGNLPTWTISIQVVSIQEVKTATFDMFDITKRWPVDLYPLIQIGKMVLNENPSNYFADMEQLAFCPGNLVPGIVGGVDKLFQARRVAYRDAQYYRLGANFHKIKVNCPFRASTYLRDGRAPVKDNEGEAPNYYPNSFNGPNPYKDGKRTELIKVYTDPNANNFDQATELYAEMSEGERLRLVNNIVASIGNAETFLKERAIALYNLIDTDLANRIANGLQSNEDECNAE